MERLRRRAFSLVMLRFFWLLMFATFNFSVMYKLFQTKTAQSYHSREGTVFLAGHESP